MSSINTAISDSTGSHHAGTTLRSPVAPNRYESQKRRDWNTFGQYLKNHRPPLVLSRCSGAHVLEFFRYLDQFGKTKVHISNCPFYGQPNPPAACPCPLKQAWGSLDALVGRLRAAFEENGGQSETNPFGARAVRLYLRDVRDSQSKARGIAYEKKRKKLPATAKEPTTVADLNDSVSGGCDRMDQIYHENYGRRSHQFVLRSSSSETSPTVNATRGGTGGLFGGSDERLLLFQCSPGSLL